MKKILALHTGGTISMSASNDKVKTNEENPLLDTQFINENIDFDEATGKGVLVVMNDEIHTARFVTKTHTTNVDTFRTPTFGPLGIVYKRDIRFFQALISQQVCDIDELVSGVYLVKAYAGIPGAIFETLDRPETKGIVIEGLGAGNLPVEVVEPIQKLIKKGIPVVMVSRCYNGLAEPIYDYVGVEPDTPELAEFIKFYEMAADFQQRDADGVAPLLPYLAQIEKLQNWDDVNANLKELFYNGVDLPVDIGIEPDLKGDGADKRNVLWAGGVSLILPDKTYYDADNPNGPQLMKIFTEMMNQLLVKIGKSPEEAHEIVEQAKRFDASLAPYRKNSEELSDVAKLYNPMEFTQFADKVQSIDVKKLVQELLGTQPEQIIVTEPRHDKRLRKALSKQRLARGSHQTKGDY